MYIDFEGSAAGPLWGPNFVMVGYDDNGVGHMLQIFPDICNDDLRAAGKPMYFYIMPESVRMARNDQGKSMFHFTKFAGVLSQDSNIGTKGQEEVAGGVLSLTSTLGLPPAVIGSLKDQVAAEIKKNQSFNSHQLFRLGTPPTFELGFVPIEQNEVAVSNLTLADVSDPAKQQAPDDKWLWKMQGQGLGSLDPNGTNACTAMVGQFPAALIEAGFKGESSPLFIHNALKLRFRTPSIRIRVQADYQKIYNAYSSNTKYKDSWNQLNIHRAFEENSLGGFCKTVIMYGDLELTDKDKQAYEDVAQQAKNAIMANVTKFIFEKQPDSIAQAEADPTHSRQRVKDYSLFWGLYDHYSTVESDEGYSYALNTKFDASRLSLADEIDVQGPYFVTTVVSGDMKGFFQEIKGNPDATKEYFDFVNLGDAFRKIHVIATSRADWPDDQGGGDPLDKLAIAVGYSDKDGVVQYHNSGRYYDNLSKKLSDDFKPAIWTRDDKDAVFVFDFAVDDNVPAEKRNQISIKRSVTYRMDERVKVNPDNEIHIPDEATTNTQIEVHADVLGHLKVGPVYLAADLNKHMLVEITFTTEGFDPMTLMFTNDNLTVKQSFRVWTAKAAVAIPWSYKVRVTYKSFGPLAAIQYEGDEVKMQGSYPTGISINLPSPPDSIIQQLTAFRQQAKQLEALDS